MNIAKEDLDKVALSEQEYELIIRELGREPTGVELGILGSLWSEHCGYKHSKPLLKLLPSSGRRVMVGLGEENAGVVNIGDGLVVVMKMESHNHPSAVEPFQGAATGIGGIVRDIFTMGARPVALMNSLCFGPLFQTHNRYLCNGVIDGIASYGNCLGIPNVGGELSFSECYSFNPLVNVLCLGIAREGELVSSSMEGEGNILMLVGADTGRDGIYGASGLASRTLDGDQELRPTVQVGNPFLEKLLIEACLELAHTDWIVGMQDLGAAGLTSSAIESAAKGGCGLNIDVLEVPRREDNMTPYEVMLSESQERMLLIVKKGYQDEVKALFDRWEIASAVIGQVTGDGIAIVREGEEITAEVPVSLLSNPPLYRPRARRPSWLGKAQSLDLRDVSDVKPRQCKSVLLQLLSSPNIASKEVVYRQYDHQVLNNSVVLPGSDAAVLRVKGTKKGLALTTDSNGKYCYLDPFVGGAVAVAEAARNLVCSGADPMAVTDCLNFGDPEKGEVYYQLRECIKGIARACRELQLPVISGNVSLYNESKEGAIYPTPVIGMVGLIDDISNCCTPSFKDEGDLVFLLGEGFSGVEGRDGLGGSEYLAVVHGLVKGKPSMDLSLERRVQGCLLESIRAGLIKSAHDCSHGGLAVTVAESCIAGNIGLRGEISCYLEEHPAKGKETPDASTRLDSILFGERQSRIVISLTRSALVKLSRIARKWRVSMAFLGEVGGQHLIVEGYIDVSIAELRKTWEGGLSRALQGGA